MPTKNEAGNVETLITQIQRATAGIDAEILFVDDSSDDTPQAIEQAAERHEIDVHLIARPRNARAGGLSTAVIEGMRAARGQWVCVMDADLQHPPELIPRMLEHALETQADLVLASRFAPGGDAKSLGQRRFVISRLLHFTIRILFAGRLAGTTDALTGFFLVKRDAVDLRALRPLGFKILLEILVRAPDLHVEELPFEFGSRHAGDSKATLREGLRLIRHLVNLRLTCDQRFVRFLAVGASGVLVNSLALAALTELLGLHYLLSAVAATQVSTSWNFGLAEAWVFEDRTGSRPVLARYGRFLLMNNSLLALRGPLLALLVSVLGMHYIVANVISLVAIAVFRFVLADRWIWAKRSDVVKVEGEAVSVLDTQAAAPAKNGRAPGVSLPVGEQFDFCYDVHGVVRVGSMYSLPELEFFRVAGPLEEADIRVRPERRRKVRGAEDSTRYEEGLGRYGFEVTIDYKERVEVAVSLMLRLSPHVLYTNAIEPVLRWTFVRNGYALVHGACVSFDGRGVLITARTDTGKTTTVLRSLTYHRCGFVSDDMTILGRDGRVMSYPKPLTISRHTLQAVDGANLTASERLALLVQSQLHSRSGRRIAQLLSRMNLPAASLNAVVQMVIPPPKYMVHRLVTDVEYVQGAQLTNFILIERGPELEENLYHRQAVEALISNAEDAYGFPPYPVLADFLSTWDGQDLHRVEHGIVDQALRGCRKTRLRDSSYRWWEHLPALLDLPPVVAVRPEYAL